MPAWVTDCACSAAWLVSSVDALARSTIRTWRSAPWATSPTACAISPTAFPASSDEVAICCDDELSVAAAPETSPIIERRLRAMCANALPSASRSDFGSISTVRSPPARRSAAAAISFRYASMRWNAAAVFPSSSRELTLTSCSTSPSAIPFAARSIWPVPFAIAREMTKAIAAASNTATTSRMTMRRVADDFVDLAEASWTSTRFWLTAAQASMSLWMAV